MAKFKRYQKKNVEPELTDEQKAILKANAEALAEEIYLGNMKAFKANRKNQPDAKEPEMPAHMVKPAPKPKKKDK